MSKRINIILPDSTALVLDREAPKGRRSQFISEAVLHFVEARRKEDLRERLKAGAIANAERDLAMAREWAPLEEEALRIMDTEERTHLLLAAGTSGSPASTLL